MTSSKADLHCDHPAPANLRTHMSQVESKSPDTCAVLPIARYLQSHHSTGPLAGH